ncbi:MAG TPA: chemotaxis protein CheW [Kofleriaceae bacterium]|nr:chemotaxis protein CheW [Kofleriaceae bacterium]
MTTSGVIPSGTSVRSSVRATQREDGVCAFWLGGRCLGLDVSMVGEVVSLDATTFVPNARPAVRGVFNLRGAPIVVLDLGEVLQLGDRVATSHSGKIGLILRAGDLVAAVQVDRVEAVIPPGRAQFSPSADQAEHRAVLGLLDDRAASGRVITVLDPEILFDSLQALRYLTDADE